MSTLLNPGNIAPNFSGTDQDNNTINLADFAGYKVVLFFYPKADTPGCTAEACNLRDNYNDLLSKGFKIIGVSADKVKKQKGFAEKFSLSFPLIADENTEIIKSYGAWGTKKMYGKEYEGIVRTTYIISEKGIIEKVFSKVDTANHTQQILDSYKD